MILNKTGKMEKEFVFLFFAVLLVATPFALSLTETGDYEGNLQVSSGQGNIIITGPGQMPAHYCGNGIMEISNGEDCDGSDMPLKLCSDINSQWTGNLACYPAGSGPNSCNYDESGCSSAVYCGDGICNNGETCSSCSQDCGSCQGGGSGGGGSPSSLSTSLTCVESWQCSEWNTCKGGKQTRTCTDSNSCGTTNLKPSLERECTVEGASGEAGIGLNTGKAGITGGVIGTLGTGGTIALLFIVIIGVLALIVFSRGKKKRK